MGVSVVSEVVLFEAEVLSDPWLSTEADVFSEAEVWSDGEVLTVADVLSEAESFSTGLGPSSRSENIAEPVWLSGAELWSDTELLSETRVEISLNFSSKYN